MESDTTLWGLEPHTRGKHLVLREYLNAWLPIMGMRQKRILFIDGFAGPGEYASGEEGSPLVALKALEEHSARDRITAEVGFIFIEKDPRRASYLRQVIGQREDSLPCNCWTKVIEGVFDDTMTKVLNELDAQEQQVGPSFVMIDPFGVSGTPMRVVRRILQNRSSEVYISFMYESINRFRQTPEFESHLDDLFGCTDWREGIGINEPSARKDFFYNLYEGQLRNAGAQHVVRFELYEARRLVYAIFFGTQHPKGCDRMKQAIWKVAPWGDFAFHGSHSAQLALSLTNPDFEPLKESLRQQFRGKGWVGIGEVEDFVSSDQTDYHTGQLRRGALVPLENDGRVQVDESTRRRRRTYPSGTRLRFL
jgi:three-Cys-motif partner protein